MRVTHLPTGITAECQDGRSQHSNKAKALLDDAERSGFFALEDVYDRDVTDLPSSIMRVVGKGRDKRVVARVGTPESFKELFGRAEQTLFSMPWKPLPQTK